ncbi:MAG: hypothetical protein AB7S26_30260 [Sandaracinaceae bacterium]
MCLPTSSTDPRDRLAALDGSATDVRIAPSSFERQVALAGSRFA